MTEAVYFYATLGIFALGIFAMVQLVLRRDMRKHPPKR